MPRKPKAETAVAVVKPTRVVANKEEASVEAFISQAIAQNVPVETMERLLAMRKELKAEQAREAFIAAMAKFQSECPIIKKTKEVHTRNGELAYVYAPIESIVNQVKDLVNANGFSYSTDIDMLDHSVKATITIQHINGHSEQKSMTVPLGSKTAVMSDSQVVAAASTFAKRYAFLNAFGILTGDQDNDGAVVPPTTPVAPAAAAPSKLDANNPVFATYKKQLQSAKSIDELGKVWANMPLQAKTALNEIKEEMKAMIISEGGTVID